MKENNDIFNKLGVNTTSALERHQETSKSYVRLLLQVQEQIEKLTTQKNLLERMVKMSSEIAELMSGATPSASEKRKTTGKKLRKDGKPWGPNPHNLRLQAETDKKNLSLFVSKTGTPRSVRSEDLGKMLTGIQSWRYLRACAGLNYITSTRKNGVGKYKIYEITKAGMERLKEVSKCA